MGVESKHDGDDDTTYRIVAESSRARRRRPSESGEHPLDEVASQDGEAAPDDSGQNDAIELAEDRGPAAKDEGGAHQGERADAVSQVDAEAGDGEGVPSLDELDPLIGRGDYATICRRLGPVTRAAELPPALALLYATAHKEVSPDEQSAEVNYLAIRSLATLLGIAEDSRIALNLAKRIVRQNPVTGPRPAPPPVARVALIVLGLAVGIVAGWLAGPGGVDLVEIIEAVLR